MLGSDEFASKFGPIDQMTDTQFLDVMYQTAFNRNADEGGLQFWLDKLASGMSRGEVAVRFAYSAEAQATFDTRSSGPDRSAPVLPGASKPASPARWFFSFQHFFEGSAHIRCIVRSDAPLRPVGGMVALGGHSTARRNAVFRPRPRAAEARRPWAAVCRSDLGMTGHDAGK